MNAPDRNAVGGVLRTAVINVRGAAQRLGVSESLLARLIDPKEATTAAINPALPDGTVAHLEVYIAVHNDTLGPAKGGIRMTGSVSLDEVVGLAMEMTWKTALIGVPFGGGKSGIRYDPTGMSAEAKEVVIRSFTRGLSRHIGPEVYVPAPDMGTDERDMGHIRDCIAYSQGRAITQGCFVTGKPVILGGIAGRRQATGKGVARAIQAACEARGVDIANARVAVQGLGNVGGVAAAELARRGACIVAAADISGGTTNPDGLDLPALMAHVEATGGVKGFAGGAAAGSQDVLEVDCDVLVPAAAGSVITAGNAPNIRAAIVAEGANAPTTPEADDILNRRGVFIIPDILCNAGGVFVSYLEYTQETQREQMTLGDVEARLAGRMAEKFAEVHDHARRHDETMRHAAMDIAVSKVVEGITARGQLP